MTDDIPPKFSQDNYSNINMFTHNFSIKQIKKTIQKYTSKLALPVAAGTLTHYYLRSQ